MADAQVHIDTMKAWRLIADANGLKPEEVVTLAANLSGLAVDDAFLNEETAKAAIEVAAMAIHTAWWSKRKVRMREARPRVRA